MAIDLGFTHFAFLGGEPSIRHDVEQIFLPFCDRELACEVMVITNGLVFNESMYRSLFETKARKARLVFSLDSLKSPNYKNQNPVKCLKNVLGIRNIAKQFSNNVRSRDVSVHTVISRENYKDFGNLVRKFHSLGIDVSLALVCPSHFIEGGTAEDFNEFTHDELECIRDQLRSLEEEDLLNFANRTLLEYLQTYPRGTLNMSDSCKAGTQHVIINPDGEVYPCITESYRKGLQFGNIQEESFSDIYRRMASFSCTSEFSSSCWDHYVWNRMGERLDGGIG
jgi:MoaA/NifB/PqqE/SkfB family radical SAM enzyme